LRLNVNLTAYANVFDINLLATLSLGLIGLQLLLMLVSCLFVPKISIEDEEIRPSQIWTALGRISSVVGIINFAVDIALIVLGIMF